MSETHEHAKREGAAPAAPVQHEPSAMPGNAAQQALMQRKIQKRASQRGAPAPAAEAHAADASGGGAPSGIDLATLQAFIARHEGSVSHVYLDSRGFKTAGIGHLLVGGDWTVGEPVSAAQVTAWFNSDVAKAIEGARQDMGDAFDRLDEARKMVIIDMVFNLGQGGFGQFQATIHAIQTGAYAQAADNMLQSLWAKQVGSRAIEDAAIMRSGALSGGGGTGGAQTGGTTSTGGGTKPAGGGGHPTSGNKEAPSIAAVRAGHGVIEIGEKGPSVAEIQRQLHVTADGVFGPHTKSAVESFQRAHHLTADGIVGEKTITALEGKAPAKPTQPPPHSGHQPPNSSGGAGLTGGTPAPGAGHHGGSGHGTGHGGTGTGGATAGGGTSHGKWSPAPSLGEVKSGKATLHEGEKGAAVEDVQKLLGVATDGEFGPGTLAAVIAFQRGHKEARHDGVVDAHTLQALEQHPAGSIGGESHDGAAQRERMLAIARAGSAGRRPDGRCYYHVCQFLIQCRGYGKITDPYTQFPSADLPEAHDFANLMNADGPSRFGLERLSIKNPYDAPAGAIVVVAAGSPGTANPTAGDIAIADGSGNFYNGGMMGYGGRSVWDASPRAKLLGCYVPK